MHLQENSLVDLDLGVKVTRNDAQYPLDHVTYAPTSNYLRGDTFTRNLTDARTTLVKH